MNWDQIETEWMSMMRRIRPDWPMADGNASPTVQTVDAVELGSALSRIGSRPVDQTTESTMPQLK